MQDTFGAIVGMEPVTDGCAECGVSIDAPDSNDSIEVDDRMLCIGCARRFGYIRCPECAVVTDDFQYDGNNDCYCDDCYDEKYIRCEDCDCEVCKEDSVCDSSGEYYCEECYNERYCHCSSCNCEVDSNHIRTDDSEEVYCQECYNEHYNECEGCGHEVDNDHTFYCEADGCAYCENCYPRRRDNDCVGREWEYGRFRPSALYKEIRSRRKFGVELETHKCPDHADLEGQTSFDCRADGSIKGKEFTSPVLSSDKGLDEIRKFCRLANDNGFEVNSDCGFHAHFDVSDLEAEEKSSVAYAYLRTYEVWAAFVKDSRRNNHYCKPVSWDRDVLSGFADNYDWKHFSANTDRYVWCNLHAYGKHGTFEIRLHTATLDGEKVCNWIKAHTRFIDWASKKTLDEIDEIFGSADDNSRPYGGTDSAYTARKERIKRAAKHGFRALCAIWADTELSDFYGSRAKEFGTDLTTTRKLQPVTV